MARTVEYPVYQEIVDHHRRHGGTTSLFVGRKGSGKTTLLQLNARVQLQRRETCLWYGREYADWVRFPVEWKIPVHLFLPEEGVYRFFRMKAEPGQEEETDLLDFAARVVPYGKVRDVLNGMKPGVLNVFYTLDPNGVDEAHPALALWDVLVRRLDTRWVSLFKRYVSLYGAVQDYRDLDYRALSKIQYYVYLKGATPTRDSLVPPYFTKRLPLGRGIIESAGWFQYFRFPELAQVGEYALKLVGTVEEDLR